MGNYFEGELTFRFELKDDEDSRILLSYLYFIRSLDVIWNDIGYKEICAKISDWVSSHPGWFSDGLNYWKSKYGDIRCPSYVEVSAFIGDTRKDLSDILYMLGENNELSDNMVPECDVTYDRLVNEITNAGGDPSTSECRPVMEIGFSVCEKCNSDETLRKLISLWSPYIFNDELGTIADEDNTFYKTYWRWNENHAQHYEFCGDWCPEYFAESSCVKSRCLYLYDLGKTGKISSAIIGD